MQQCSTPTVTTTSAPAQAGATSPANVPAVIDLTTITSAEGVPTAHTLATDCPAWCREHVAVNGTCLHEAYIGGVGEDATSSAYTGTHVGLSAYTGARTSPAEVEITGKHNLTGADARRVAALLVEAADRLDLRGLCSTETPNSAPVDSTDGCDDAGCSFGWRGTSDGLEEHPCHLDGLSGADPITCPAWCSNCVAGDWSAPTVHEHLVGTVLGHATFEGASGVDVSVAQADGTPVAIAVMGDGEVDAAGAAELITLLRQAIDTAEGRTPRAGVGVAAEPTAIPARELPNALWFDVTDTLARHGLRPPALEVLLALHGLLDVTPTADGGRKA